MVLKKAFFLTESIIARAASLLRCLVNLPFLERVQIVVAPSVIVVTTFVMVVMIAVNPHILL